MKQISDGLNRFIHVALLPFSVWQAGSLADKFTFTDKLTFLVCYLAFIPVFYAINRMGFYLIKIVYEHLLDDLERQKQGKKKIISHK